MDYTEVPHSLIYYKRRSLEEFFASNPMNETLVDNISKVYYMQKNFKERALKCMNTSYYICTLIMGENHPEWSFDKYCDLAWCKDKDINIHQAITLSLVYVYLKGMGEDKKQSLEKLITKLDDFLSPYRFIQIGDPFLGDYSYLSALNQVEDRLTSYSVGEKEFALRVIDKDAIQDALSERDFNWPKFTTFWDERSLRDIVMTLGNTEEEKNNVIDLLFETSKGFYYTKGYNPNIEEVEKKLKRIRKEINRHFNSNIDEEQISKKSNTGDENSTANIDADEQEIRIGELEGKVSNLQRKLQEANQIIEEFRQPVEELTAKDKIRMAFALQLLKEAGLTDDTIKVRGNGAKVAKIMSFLLEIVSKNERGNNAQICQTFLSDSGKYYPQTQDNNTLIELNTLCSVLGIKVCLSMESQSNNKR